METTIKNIKFDLSQMAGRVNNGSFDQTSRYGKVIFWSKSIKGMVQGKTYSGTFSITEPTISKVGFIEPVSISCLDDIKPEIEVTHSTYNCNRPAVYINEIHPLYNQVSKYLFDYHWGSSKEIPAEFIKYISWSADEVEQGIKAKMPNQYWPVTTAKKYGQIIPRIAFVDLDKQEISLYDKTEYTCLSFDGENTTVYSGFEEINEGKTLSFIATPKVLSTLWYIKNNTLYKVSEISESYSFDSEKIKGYKVANEGDLLLSGKMAEIRNYIKKETVLESDSFQSLIYMISLQFPKLLNNLKKYTFNFGIRWLSTSDEIIVCWEGQNQIKYSGSCAAYGEESCSLSYDSDGDRCADWSRPRLASYSFDAVITPNSVISVLEQKKVDGNSYIRDIDFSVSDLISNEYDKINTEQKAREAKELVEQTAQIKANLKAKIEDEIRARYFGQNNAENWYYFMDGMQDCEDSKFFAKLEKCESEISQKVESQFKLILKQLGL